MSENIYYERIKYALKMQEDVYLSDLIFPDAVPEFRNMIETFSAQANEELKKILIQIYGDEIKTRFEHFWEFISDNYIHPVEIIAMKNDIELIEDENPKNLVRRFGRLKRIKIVDINSEEFDYRKFNRFILAGETKLLIGIDKRFKINDMSKYFTHLGQNFYEYKPQNLFIKQNNA